VLKDARVDGRLRLEVLVVTHYDLDHIQGVIELLNDIPDWLEIGEIWFNGHHHLAPPDILGSKEGDSLSKLISGLKLPWNVSFDKQNSDGRGGRILQTSDAVALPGGIVVKVLSPDESGMAALARDWSDPALPPTEDESVPSDMMGHKDAWPPKQHSLYGGVGFVSDRSVPNRSSIALLLTHEDKRVVLTGDAYSNVINEGLAMHLPNGESVDLLKVSHHGSKGNTDKQLLERLECKRFLISTSGKTHKHPDHALIARLVARHDSPEIFFNYSKGWPGNWQNRPSGWPVFTARYPDGTDHFVDVLL
jgi:glyoxylase-like metal-dependent hydrolase (beta-lactamase superfamily II)